MQAQSPPRQANNLLAWVIAALGVTLLLLLLLSFMAEAQPPASSEVAGATSNRIAYLEFGLNADTLWLADPAAPTERREVLKVHHASQYGALPSISPDGAHFAYTALPDGLARPKPDSPAGLWVAPIEEGARPRQIADDIDLMVAPLWTPDGASLLYRRSTEGAHVLALTALDGSEERVVARSDVESLFPVGFAHGGETLYYAGISDRGGTHLYAVSPAGGAETRVAKLSPGLTRDWTLSPDGTRLAYLEIAFSEAEVASRASVLDVESGAAVPLTSTDEVALGPLWSDSTELTVGVFKPGASESSLLRVDGASRSHINGPATGFNVPVAYDAKTDTYLVRAFENDSITAPGRSVLVLVGPDGERTTVAEGEVSLVGWIRP